MPLLKANGLKVPVVEVPVPVPVPDPVLVVVVELPVEVDVPVPNPPNIPKGSKEEKGSTEPEVPEVPVPVVVVRGAQGFGKGDVFGVVPLGVVVDEEALEDVVVPEVSVERKDEVIASIIGS